MLFVLDHALSLAQSPCIFRNIIVTDVDGKHTITIEAITPEQAGELSCQASNSVGLKKQNVQLAVKLIGEAPMFTRNLEDRLVTESEVTVMEAKLKLVSRQHTSDRSRSDNFGGFLETN